PFVGFATFATDVIGRHAWQLVAAASTTDAKLRGSLRYSYAGLGTPVLSLFADQSWDGYGPLTGRSASGRVDTLFVRERDRNVQLAATFPLSRFRRSTSLTLSAGLAAEDSELLDSNADPTTAYRMDALRSRLADVRASLGVSTARGHAFSISAEEGAALSLQGRVRRHLRLADSLEARAGADRSFSEGTGRLRLYQPLRALGLRRHVIALRASGGAAGGPGADRFHFDVGGGTTHFFPVRGYANGERAGRLAWSATAEYRFPIVRVNRGWGLIPIHLDQVSGAFFADAGNAWGPELDAALPRYQNPVRTALGSAGAELAADLLTFFTVSFPLRGGVAFPLTAATRGGTSPRWYMSLGSSF
ncbi:MAG: hypothetical protein EXR95_06645, partial [Gemmatimonadetes bacterium]|nr:hypothetical protein [Gemmatimonadota bacterium]